MIASAPRGGLTFLVDLRVAQYNGDRGIPAYAQSLVRQLCLDEPDHRYLFLWDERLPRPSFAKEFERYGTWEVEAPLARGERGRIDVLFTACFFVPLHGRGEAYLYPRWLRRHQPHRLGIVYDLIPYLFPERYLASPEARDAYFAGIRVMRDSDRLFAISQATRLDTIRLAGFDPTRIRCVYGDIDHHKRALMGSPAASDRTVPARFGLQQPYAVYIGGDDWRKNIDGTVRAFALFNARHPDRQLAVLCKLSPVRIAEYQRLADSLGIRPGALVFTGYVSDEDLVALTSQAELMVYPSLYEGLGLPVLEAYGCGIPVVGSDSSSIKELVIPEVACDPRKPAAVAAAMSRLVEEPRLREASLARGRELLAMLGWRPAARAVMEELTVRPAARSGRAVAVVGVLAPGGGAVAADPIARLQSSRWRTDFFDASLGATVADVRPLRSGNRILPVEVLGPALAAGDHETVVFLLGSGPGQGRVWRAVMQTRLGCRQRRLAFISAGDLAEVVADLRPGAAESGGAGFLAERAGIDRLVVDEDPSNRLDALLGHSRGDDPLPAPGGVACG